MKKKVYLWLLAMCVTAGTATPVYAVEPVAEQSTVEENQEPENTPDIPAPEVSGEETEAPVGPETSGEE